MPTEDTRGPHAQFIVKDPYPEWAEARRDDPVAETEAFGRKSFQLSRFEHVEAALRDSETFSSTINQETMGPYMGQVILAKGGDEHTRYRNLVSTAFRASRLEHWRTELIEPTIHRLLDGIAAKGRGDLVLDVTRQYPVQIIAGIIGVPLEDHEQFHAWAEAINVGPLEPEKGMAASRAMREYLTPIVEDRRANPRADVISDIIHAEIDGEKLDDDHVYGFLRLLMPAGAETTFRVMGNCLHALLSQPDVLERVRSDRSLVSEAIEETLRFETSVTIVSRVAAKDASIGGVDVPKGASMMLLTGSANRDEARYDRPDTWDIDRKDKNHLAFGWGRHLCLGMHLARLELASGIDAILDRLPDLRFDPESPVPEIVGFAFRGPESLPVVFRPS
ncbi:MAG: cytochrome P450 [Myxococcales bacterium]|nr:cytochrome P450 [Myxococcales bacterium]